MHRSVIPHATSISGSKNWAPANVRYLTMHYEKRKKKLGQPGKKRAVQYRIEIVSKSVGFIAKESKRKAGSQTAKLESKSNALHWFGRKKLAELKRLGARVKK